MVKPFLSIILRLPGDLSTAVGGLIELDRLLGGSDFSYEIVIPCFKEDWREPLVRFNSLVRYARVVDGASGISSAKGTWRLFMSAKTPELIQLFPRIAEASKQGGDMFIGVRKGRDFVKNMLVRRLLRSDVTDHFAGFRCMNSKVIDELAGRKDVDWHSDLDPIIISKLRKLNVVEVSLVEGENSMNKFGIIKLLGSIVRLRKVVKSVAIEKK